VTTTQETIVIMLYVGHFSFTIDEALDDGPAHGVFSCVAEAGDVDDALEKLRALIVRLKEEDDTLTGVSEVYLDSCVEIRSLPEAGMMTYWISWPHEETTSISTGLRWAGEDEAVGYSVVPDDGGEAGHAHEGEHADGHEHAHEGDEDDDGWEVEPFVEF
jgi:hypothetical protein